MLPLRPEPFPKSRATERPGSCGIRDVVVPVAEQFAYSSHGLGHVGMALGLGKGGTLVGTILNRVKQVVQCFDGKQLCNWICREMPARRNGNRMVGLTPGRAGIVNIRTWRLVGTWSCAAIGCAPRMRGPDPGGVDRCERYPSSMHKKKQL